MSLGPVWPPIDDEIVDNPGSVALGAATCPVADCLVVGNARTARLSPEGVLDQVELGPIQVMAASPGHYWVEVTNVKPVDPEETPLDTTLNEILLTVTK